MKKLRFGFFAVMMLLVMSVFITGCGGMFSEEVPPGYVGMVQTPEGLTGTLLRPGWHSCWGRDKMVLIETKEAISTEGLSILCTDDLNFKFDLNVRYMLAVKDTKSVMEVLDRIGSNIKWNGDRGVLPISVLYQTYVKPVAVSKARGVVSKYRTTDIRNARAEIDKRVWDGITGDLQGTPVTVRLVNSSNYDYPDIITKAMEKKREREIALKEERAKQAVELLKAENRLKIAEQLKAVRAAEAEAESVYVKILGAALTDSYLELKGIEAKLALYTQVAPGDKVIVTGEGSAIPMVNSPIVEKPLAAK